MANTGSKQDVLFPILMQEPALRGAALAASEAEEVGEGHLIEFRAIKVRSILNWSRSKRRRWTAWSVNPYRGCEFGCKYCYARYTHTFLNATMGEGEYADPKLFEQRIFIKQNAPWLVEQELRKVRAGEEIAIGTATDPYQPAERTALVTRGILEVLARYEGLNIGIITKSDSDRARYRSPTDDRAAEQALAAHHHHDTEHRTGAEAGAEGAAAGSAVCCRPRIEKSWAAGGRHELPAVAGYHGQRDGDGRDGASGEGGGCELSWAQVPLFLKPCSKSTYFAFVREHFPHLVEQRLEKRFAERDFARELVCEERMSRYWPRGAVRKKHGVGQRSTVDADGGGRCRCANAQVLGALGRYPG